MALGSSGLEQKTGPADRVIITSDSEETPERLEVKEIYVSKATGKLTIVYEDDEE